MAVGSLKVKSWSVRRNFRNDQIELSVLSPLGAAVLGMSIGHRMKFLSIEGGVHSVIVEDVVAPAGAPLRFPLKARRRGHSGFYRVSRAR